VCCHLNSYFYCCYTTIPVYFAGVLQFSKDPTQVQGYDNLFCMEIDPEVDVSDELGELGADDDSGGLQVVV